MKGRGKRKVGAVVPNLTQQQLADAEAAASADGLELEAWIKRLVLLGIGAWKSKLDVKELIR